MADCLHHRSPPAACTTRAAEREVHPRAPLRHRADARCGVRRGGERGAVVGVEAGRQVQAAQGVNSYITQKTKTQ
eukprot:46682-Eustigmatos_ZCMA.PRE.1